MERKKKFLIVVFLTSVFLLFVIISLIVFLFLYTKTSKKKELRNSFEVLQYTEIEKYTKATYSFVKLNRKIQDEEYFSYFNEEKKSQIFISRIGEEEYECTGSCYCDGERRVALPVSLSSGLFLILAAFSVNLAVNIARDSFQNNCFEKLAEYCDSNNIKADDVSCQSAAGQLRQKMEDKFKDDFVELTSEEFDKKYSKEKESSLKRSYNCHGYCMNNEELRSNGGDKALQLAIQNIGPCESLEMTGDVDVKVIVADGNFRDPKDELEFAKKTFVSSQLGPFCSVNSKKPYFIELKKNGVIQKKKKYGAFCVAEDKITNPNLSNVRCVSTYG